MYDFVVNNSQMFNNEITKSEFPLYLQQDLHWFKFNIFVIREIKN